jgi:hypothetical protein
VSQQWCVVRGCVALADDPHVPYLCRIHTSMTKPERDAWSREHSFQMPVLRSVHAGIEFQRADGSVYGYDHDGKVYEGRR